jgi:3-oxoacyl-[acyl-carrier-protein] synthase II
VRIACARIAAGQGDIMLVGGSYNAQRPDVLLHVEMDRLLRRAPFEPVWARQASSGGLILGSLGCFLVIENREHAAARGVTAYGHIASVRTDRCRRRPGEATANAKAQLATMTQHFDPATTAVISGASGASAPTLEEQAFLRAVGLPVRASVTALGSTMEPSFPASLALAAMSVRHGSLFPPLEAVEEIMAGPLRQALVTSWGHWRGEAMALVMAA